MSNSAVCSRTSTARKFIQTVVKGVQKTHQRIGPYVRKTALDFSIWLSEETTKTSVYFKLGTTFLSVFAESGIDGKANIQIVSIMINFISFFFIFLENEQVTGSFKARGAFNKICIIKEENEASGKNLSVTTASSGNHGQACVCKICMKCSQCNMSVKYRGHHYCIKYPAS